MSIGGPSALGTLLVQRLDAVLGTTLSQQTNLISGARPDAVSQPADTGKPEPGRDELVRHPREAVDKSQGRIQSDRRGAVAKSSSAARQPASGEHAPADIDGTPSAPTRLGGAARIILALLAEFPDQAPPVTAHAALFDPAAAKAEARPGAATPEATPTHPNPSRSDSPHPDPSRSDSLRLDTALGDSGTAGRPGLRSGGPPASGTPAAPAGAGAPSAPSLPATLAQALNLALEQSGLFYESHLADVAFGRREAGTLSNEPQGGLNSPPHNARTDSPAGMSALAQPSATGLPAESHLLVRQQLETLANQAFVWQGPAWPGAEMRWTVERHTARDTHGGSEAPPHWTTHLRITLPRLGPIDASLTIAGPRIAMRLGSSDGAPTLETHKAELRARLLAAGLSPGDIIIDAEAGTHDTRVADGAHDGA